MPLTKRIHDRCNCADHISIVVAYNAASSALVLAYFNNAITVSIYIVIVPSITIATSYKLLSSSNTVRSAIFVTMSVVMLLPFIHYALIECDDYKTTMAALYMILCNVTWIIGVGIYVMKLPEYYYFGAFDLYGSSHQIWHILSVVGLYMQYMQLTTIMGEN